MSLFASTTLRLWARKIRSAFVRLRHAVGPHPERFLKRARGVIHVGANTGQERKVYARHRLNVVWIEPVPSIFATLQANIASYPRQRAVQGLVSDSNGQQVDFHVASNGGASSSMLDLKLHRDVWPEIVYEQTISLTTISLPLLVERERIDVRLYDVLVLDTQGTELKVLQGAEPILHCFSLIQIEVADFEAYAGCCQLSDIREFLLSRGYRECMLRTFGAHSGGGRYYEMAYLRTTDRVACSAGMRPKGN